MIGTSLSWLHINWVERFTFRVCFLQSGLQAEKDQAKKEAAAKQAEEQRRQLEASESKVIVRKKHVVIIVARMHSGEWMAE